MFHRESKSLFMNFILLLMDPSYALKKRFFYINITGIKNMGFKSYFGHILLTDCMQLQSCYLTNIGI